VTVDRVRPQCRGGYYTTDQSSTAHGPHEYFPDPYGGTNGCRGWTQADAGATALAERLDRVCRDAAWPVGLPPGARLECHPSVARALSQLYVPSYAEFTASLAAAGEAPLIPQMPVVNARDLADGQWRITSDSGLIAEGNITS
jgi:hypothetical protein